MSTTSCGRNVSLWAVVVTAHNGASWVSLVNSSFTDCDKHARGLEDKSARRHRIGFADPTFAVVPAQYDAGDLDPVFEKAAVHPASCEEALALMPAVRT